MRTWPPRQRNLPTTSRRSREIERSVCLGGLFYLWVDTIPASRPGFRFVTVMLLIGAHLEGEVFGRQQR